ncbi:MAG: DUF2986 domain-containing protein [Gammaproteobacteria bacterium]|nr:DUF2986 domain-containing protein [Gammaproteobacteria bacterium]
MNRKKKIQGLFKKRLKRARAKLDSRPKGEPYISKAERARAESETLVAAENLSDEAGTEKK